MPQRYKNQFKARISRPISAETARELAPFKSIGRQFPHRGLFPREHIGLTLIQRAETIHRVGVARGQTSTPVEKVFHPIPESGLRQFTFNVTGIDFFGHRLGHRALAISIDDPDGILAAEREEYMRRMGKTHARMLLPHVSVLNADSFHATSDIVQWAEGIIPKSITLNSIISYPNIPNLNPASNPDTIELDEELPSEATAAVELTAPATVRNIADIHIPDALIRSFRPRVPADTAADAPELL